MASHDHYRKIKSLGQGGFAEVHLAERDDSEHPFAIKIPFRESVNPDAKRRMQREIEIQQEIDSPHVMPILEAGPDNDWFVMPLAIGDLENLAEEGAVRSDDLRQIERIIKEIGAGLEAAHSRGFVHRDIKPSNILLLPDEDSQYGNRWVVGDWGIVRRPAGQTTTLTHRYGGGFVSHGYSAPEMYIPGTRGDARVDVFSLGQVALRLLSGDANGGTIEDLPAGPWRDWISACTHTTAARRPASMEIAMARLDRLLTPNPRGVAGQIHDRLENEQSHVSLETWQMIIDAADNTHVYKDVVTNGRPAAYELGQEWPEEAESLCEAWAENISQDFLGGSGFSRYNSGILFILSAVQGIAKSARPELVENLARLLFEVDEKRNQFATMDVIQDWLATLGPPTDSYVARALRDSGVASWYSDSRVTMNSALIQDELSA